MLSSIEHEKGLMTSGLVILCFLFSLTAVQDSLGQVDVSYFLGRSAIIVNTKGKLNMFSRICFLDFYSWQLSIGCEWVTCKSPFHSELLLTANLQF